MSLQIPGFNMIRDKENFSERDIDRIIEMAWEDRTPFDAIKVQFGLTEKEVIRLMQTHLHPNSWRRWRARVRNRPTKHAKLKSKDVLRFKSKAQKIISNNAISKRT